MFDSKQKLLYGDGGEEQYLAAALGFSRLPLDSQDTLLVSGLVEDELEPQERELWEQVSAKYGNSLGHGRQHGHVPGTDIPWLALDDDDGESADAASRRPPTPFIDADIAPLSPPRPPFLHENSYQDERWPQELHGYNTGVLTLPSRRQIMDFTGMPETEGHDEDEETAGSQSGSDDSVISELQDTPLWDEYGNFLGQIGVYHVLERTDGPAQDDEEGGEITLC